MRILAAAAIAAFLPLAALAEVRGVVYELANPNAPRDEWRRKPLPNAYVILSWSTRLPGPGHPIITCKHNEIARSDDRGRYVIEGPGLLTSAATKPRLLVYAPGMDRVDWPFAQRPEALKDISMARSTHSDEERLGLLLLFDSPGCFGQEMHDPKGVLRAYREALAAEAKALRPATDAGRRIQQSLRARVEATPR